MSEGKKNAKKAIGLALMVNGIISLPLSFLIAWTAISKFGDSRFIVWLICTMLFLIPLGINLFLIYLGRRWFQGKSVSKAPASGVERAVRCNSCGGSVKIDGKKKLVCPYCMEKLR